MVEPILSQSQDSGGVTEKHKETMASLEACDASSSCFEKDEEVEAKLNEQRKEETLFTIFWNFLTMLILFILCGYGVYLMLNNLPGFTQAEQNELWEILPKSFSERKKLLDTNNLKLLFLLFNRYSSTHLGALTIMLSSVYLFYQAFPLFLMWFPGTASAITILIGALYGWKLGMLLCCVLATIGPILAYILFKYTGKPLIMHFFSGALLKFQSKLFANTKDKWQLLSYLIFLRMTPFFPNFFISIASPVLDIPLWTFVLGTMIGLVPNTFVLVSVGASISSLSSPGKKWELYFLTLGALCIPILRHIFVKYSSFKK